VSHGFDVFWKAHDRSHHVLSIPGLLKRDYEIMIFAACPGLDPRQTMRDAVGPV
jgi:hypothetical protein